MLALAFEASTGELKPASTTGRKACGSGDWGTLECEERWSENDDWLLVLGEQVAEAAASLSADGCAEAELALVDGGLAVFCML